MNSSEAVHDSNMDYDGTSTRSRASSVFSTGTKISIATLQPEELQSSGPSVSGLTVRNTARPPSLRTLASHEVPAPPYELYQSSEVPQLSPTQRRSPALAAANLEDISTSPASEPENTFVMHYGRVVRILDQNHARELAHRTAEHEREKAHLINEHEREKAHLVNEHERAVAAVRHEIDQAYRKEWKAQSRQVEKFREEANARVASLETERKDLTVAHAAIVAQLGQDTSDRLSALVEAHELATDKARNAIEDLWEGRWNDRERLAAEEARRLELENQRRLEQALAERDQEHQLKLEKALAERDQEHQLKVEKALAERYQDHQLGFDKVLADNDRENQLKLD